MSVKSPIDIQSISFKIIGEVGEAKGNYIEVLRAVRERDIAAARACLDAGDAAYRRGHEVHNQIIAAYAAGEEVPFDVLLVHAEDQMMSAEDFSTLAHEAVDGLMRELDASA